MIAKSSSAPQQADHSTISDDWTVDPADDEKRRHPRYALKIPARFYLPDESEQVGEVRDVSLSGIALRTDLAAKEGDSVVLHMDDLGRFEGSVARVFDDIFAVELLGRSHKRRRGAKFFSWGDEETQENDSESRLHLRIAISQLAELQREDGTVVPCRIANLSLGGLGLEMREPPAVGEIVQIGDMRGRVVHHDGLEVGISLISEPQEI